MERELKFRVWDRHTKEMAQGRQLSITFRHGEIDSIRFDYDDHGYWMNAKTPLDRDRYKVMQFTGLFDKDGVQIFEGDVLECSLPLSGKHLKEVQFVDNGYWTLWDYNAKFWPAECFVVGNIYENPELLEQKEAA
jgi:uncharacterized phage protein (TIGR01671 family)